MNDEQSRRTAVNSRSGYKSKATRVKRVAEKYTKDESLLALTSALPEIEHNLSLLPDLRTNLERIQDVIVMMLDSDEEIYRESEEFKITMDNLDAAENELLALRVKARELPQSEDPAKGIIQVLASKLDEMQIQAEVERRVAEEKHKADREADQRKFEATLQQVVNNSFRASSPINHNPPSHVKLRELTVPEFDGKYSEWMSFRDLFTAVIHRNESLSNAHKMYYLLSLLKGEARAVVEHLPMTSTNYLVAWDLLMERYDDPMGMATSYMRDFMSTPKLSEPSAEAIRKAHTTVMSTVQAIDAIGMEQRDIWLIFLTLEKMDPETKVLWSRASYKKIPTWKEFSNFLVERYKTLEIANAGNSTKSQKKVEMKPKQHIKVPNWSSNVAQGSSSTPPNSASPPITCACCGKDNHRTVKCYKFRGMTDAKRLELVRQAKLCSNCLDPGHIAAQCKSSECKRCSEKHSTWLHEAFHPVSQGNTATTSSNIASMDSNATTEQVDLSQEDFSSYSCTLPTEMPQVLLCTAVLNVQDAEGRKVPCRALLDSGSQPNFISERMCQLLRLPKTRTNCRIEGIGAIQAAASHQVSVSFGPRGFNNWMQARFLVQPKITGVHPAVRVKAGSLSIPPKLVLADPQWHQPQAIDMLLGAQLFWDLVLDKTIRLGPGLPILKQSIFGWLVAGEIASVDVKHAIQSCNLSTLESLDLSLRRFWELEELAGPAQQKKDEDIRVEKMYEETVSRDVDGRFILQMPITEKVDELSNNKSNALRQLYFLEKRLNSNPTMKKMYQDVFTEYLKLNIIERVPLEELQNKAYYMPHHGVYKESSTSTKLRIVFNASSKTKSSLSFNDIIMTGPVVQDSLVEILWRFRQGQWALTCDITKMYLQFMVIPKHRDFLRFLWRNPETNEIETFRFRTLCFGVACSPYLATRSLRQLAIEDGEKYPLARDVVMSAFYVDDCLVSADSIDEIHRIRDELTNLLRGAGLELSKWTSNVPGFCTNDDAKDVTTNVDMNEPIKTLGLYWDHQADIFVFKLSQSTIPNCPTKRQVLSTIARIFDPLGLISPIVVNGKCIMQSLWKTEHGWDDEIPESAREEWNSFVKSLNIIPTIRIPRWISEITDVVRRELHIFTDASKKAYGAAAYVVTEDASGNRSSRLLTAKSRVAPVKVTTIPKLELCAAELGAKLWNSLRNSAKYDNLYCWTDASIVLWQIKSPTNREIFVRNRLTVILQHTSAGDWRHVPSAQNPADIVSRGASAEQLIDSQLWWTGPEWLRMVPEHWPEDIVMESDHTCLLVATAEENGWTSTREYLLSKSNSFSHIRRVMAWVLRFVTNCKRSATSTRSGPLQPDEIKCAELVLVKMEQQEVYGNDLKTLSGSSTKPLSKPLRKVGVFLDEKGIIRLDGRLFNARIADSAKHPIILPAGPLAKRILRDLHLRWWHAGPTLMNSELRRTYKPMFGQRVIQENFRGCVVCFRRRPQRCEQIMGQLPPPRVNLTTPFATVGIDFAGPILVKANKLRRAPAIKTYVAVFVCMATKAVHLEVVGDLFTSSFLACFRRFAARRGTPTDVYTDNATNFVGAANQIQQFLSDQTIRDSIVDATSGDNITWHFVPPKSPHWGGLWEAAVKTMKHHLYRVMGNTALTFEELNTVIVQIEGVMNSRPLTAVPNQPGDPAVLTPEKLLRPTMEDAEPLIPEWNMEKISRLSRWQLTQRLFQDVSKRWKRDYLMSLQRRVKWTKERPNLQPGDVVLMLDGVQGGAGWPLAIVTSVHPGPDGRVRRVIVRTAKSVYERTVQHLAKVPLSTEDEEETSRILSDADISPPECVGAIEKPPT